MNEIFGLTVQEVEAILGIIAIAGWVLHKVFKRLGWVEAEGFLEDLNEAFQRHKHLVTGASSTPECIKAAEIIAAEVPGVTANMIIPAIKKASSFAGTAINERFPDIGIELDVTPGGDISLDMSGMVAKKSKKAVKWLKKVF